MRWERGAPVVAAVAGALAFAASAVATSAERPLGVTGSPSAGPGFVDAPTLRGWIKLILTETSPPSWNFSGPGVDHRHTLTATCRATLTFNGTPTVGLAESYHYEEEETTTYSDGTGPYRHVTKDTASTAKTYRGSASAHFQGPPGEYVVSYQYPLPYLMYLNVVETSADRPSPPQTTSSSRPYSCWYGSGIPPIIGKTANPNLFSDFLRIDHYDSLDIHWTGDLTWKLERISPRPSPCAQQWVAARAAFERRKGLSDALNSFHDTQMLYASQRLAQALARARTAGIQIGTLVIKLRSVIQPALDELTAAQAAYKQARADQFLLQQAVAEANAQLEKARSALEDCLVGSKKPFRLASGPAPQPDALRAGSCADEQVALATAAARLAADRQALATVHPAVLAAAKTKLAGAVRRLQEVGARARARAPAAVRRLQQALTLTDPARAWLTQAVKAVARLRGQAASYANAAAAARQALAKCQRGG